MSNEKSYSDNQEVCRTIGSLKAYGRMNYWSGFLSAMVTCGVVLGGLLYIGLRNNW